MWLGHFSIEPIERSARFVYMYQRVHVRTKYAPQIRVLFTFCAAFKCVEAKRKITDGLLCAEQNVNNP